MAKTFPMERRLHAIEQDILVGERLVGCIAALAAFSSARGRTQQASEARMALASAAALLKAFYILRSLWRHDLAHDR